MPTVPKLSSGGTSTSVVKTTTKTAAPIAPQVNLATPGTTTTVRRGDYLYTYRNGVLISTKYAPTYVSTGRATTGVTSGPAVSQLQSGLTQRQTTSPPVNIVRSSGTGSSSAAGGSGMAQTAPNTYTDGLYGGTGGGVNIGGTNYGGGGSGIGSGSGGGGTGGIGSGDQPRQAYGWSAPLTQDQLMMNLQFPSRIMEQVSGIRQSDNPTFYKFMADMIAAANDPLLQYILNPTVTASGLPNDDDWYNFQANYMKNMLQPGGRGPNVGLALSAIQKALGSPDSALYNLLMGAGGSGAEAYGSQIDLIKQLIDVGTAGNVNPLTSTMMQAILSNAANTFLQYADPRSGQSAAEYLMQRFGYPTKVAKPTMPASASGLSNVPVLGSGLGGY